MAKRSANSGFFGRFWGTTEAEEWAWETPGEMLTWGPATWETDVCIIVCTCFFSKLCNMVTPQHDQFSLSCFGATFDNFLDKQNPVGGSDLQGS